MGKYKTLAALFLIIYLGKPTLQLTAGNKPSSSKKNTQKKRQTAKIDKKLLDELSATKDRVGTHLAHTLLISVILDNAEPHSNAEDKEKIRLLRTQIRDYIQPPLSDLEVDISAHIKKLKGASLTGEKEQKAREDIAKAKEAIPHINRHIQENIQQYNFLKNTKPKTVTDFIIGYLKDKNDEIIITTRQASSHTLRDAKNVRIALEKYITALQKDFLSSIFQKSMDKDMAKDLNEADRIIRICQTELKRNQLRAGAVALNAPYKSDHRQKRNITPIEMQEIKKRL